MSPLDTHLADVLRGAQPPCLSLYQPTHRAHPQREQDPIRFRNLVKSLEESLRRVYQYRKQVLAIFDELVLNERNRARLQ